MKKNTSTITVLLAIWLVAAVFTKNLIAQTGFTCASKYSPPPQSALPSNCTTFLNDLAPLANDRVIEVRVNFWIYTPTTNSATGVWTKPNTCTTYTDIVQALEEVNALFQNTVVPTIPVAGVGTYTTGVKIKFVPAGFSYVHDSNTYTLIPNAYLTNYDPNAINVYVGNNDYLGQPQEFGATCVHDYPGAAVNWVELRPDYQYNAQWNSGNQDWDNVNRRVGDLAHEFGHILGLNHTTNSESTVVPSIGCCSYTVSDYFADAGSYDPCPGTWNIYTNNWGTGSNNLMSQNRACGNQYLTPSNARQCIFI